MITLTLFGVELLSISRWLELITRIVGPQVTCWDNSLPIIDYQQSFVPQFKCNEIVSKFKLLKSNQCSHIMFDFLIGLFILIPAMTWCFIYISYIYSVFYIYKYIIYYHMCIMILKNKKNSCFHLTHICFTVRLMTGLVVRN